MDHTKPNQTKQYDPFIHPSILQVDLRQHLVMAFLPSVADRAQLRMPGTTTVDLSANCFCHNKPVTETAWVCSVCLSIFCDPAAVCPACGTEISV